MYSVLCTWYSLLTTLYSVLTTHSVGLCPSCSSRPVGLCPSCSSASMSSASSVFRPYGLQTPETGHLTFHPTWARNLDIYPQRSTLPFLKRSAFLYGESNYVSLCSVLRALRCAHEWKSLQRYYKFCIDADIYSFFLVFLHILQTVYSICYSWKLYLCSHHSAIGHDTYTIHTR